MKSPKRKPSPSNPTPTGSQHSAQGCAPSATLGHSHPNPTNPVGVSPFVQPTSLSGRVIFLPSDESIAELDVIINASIHELVFASHHLSNDDPEDAQDCLTTVGMNVDVLQEMIQTIEAAVCAAQEAADKEEAKKEAQ